MPRPLARACQRGTRWWIEYWNRTAVRDMICAGVPQSVAMRISGHRTTAVFLRYDITSEDDKRDALRRMQEHRQSRPARPAQPAVEPTPPPPLQGPAAPERKR